MCLIQTLMEKSKKFFLTLALLRMKAPDSISPAQLRNPRLWKEKRNKLIRSDVYITSETRDFFAKGLVIKVHKREPILEQTEAETEKKPLMKVVL